MNVLVNIRNNKKIKAGFTLVELVVVLAIFAAIMAVALFNQAGLSSNILLTNLAYETALAVREAQTYGIGVRASSPSAAVSNFDRGYGVYFDRTSDTTRAQIIVFGDSDGNNAYGGPSELQSLYQVQNQRGNKIQKVCVKNGVGPCAEVTDVQKLSIMFKRPNPEASFRIFDINDGEISNPTGPAVIVVNNNEGTNCRAIVVEVTGQIRVENAGGGNCSNTP